jgi:hypothetical protein
MTVTLLAKLEQCFYTAGFMLNSDKCCKLWSIKKEVTRNKMDFICAAHTAGEFTSGLTVFTTENMDTEKLISALS